MAKRSYSDEEKAQALAVVAVSDSISDAARKCGIPKGTLDRWANGERVSPEIAELAEEKKKDLKAKLDEVMYKLVDVPDGDIEKSNLTQRFTSFGIAFDKSQLLQDKPTAIVDDRRIPIEKRLDNVVSILDRARARRTG